MVLIFRRFLATLGMTGVLEKVEGRSGEAHTLNYYFLVILVRLAASSLYLNSYSVIPIEADEGGVVRNLLLYQVLTKKMIKRLGPTGGPCNTQHTFIRFRWAGT